MTVNPDAAFSRGDLMRRLTDVERGVRQSQTGRRLEAATIGRGGVRVRGGQILVEDETDQTLVRMAEGRINMRLQNTSEGEIAANAPAAGRASMQLRPPFLQGDILANRMILEGASSGAVGGFFTTVQGQASIISEQGTVFLIARGPAISHYGNANLLLAIDADGNPIADPNLGASGGTTQGTYTSYVTTGNAANCHVFTTSGRIAVVTSAARYKQDIEDLQVDPQEVLQLRPRTWRDRGDVAADPDSDRWQVGLVAEEVAQAGLTEFVDYDADGQPTTVAYDRLVVALLEVVKQQQQRLDELDGGRPSAAVADKPDRARKPKRRSAERLPVVPEAEVLPNS